ncbi:MAG: hypothetical protein LBR91_02200 [Puniceicoccales bacterium]|nr:hypothetical protein [Puniceicoccales bacterium]
MEITPKEEGVVPSGNDSTGKASFFGRKFGTSAGAKSFASKEVMSANDDK